MKNRSASLIGLIMILLFFVQGHSAQGLKKRRIALGAGVIEVEVADSDASRAQGLMGRPSLAEGHGMLFVFDRPQKLRFWMKNTLIPLSIAYIDADKMIFQIEKMRVEPLGTRSYPQYVSLRKAKYALEVPQGYFEKIGVRPGSKFRFISKDSSVPK